MLRKKSKLLIL